MTSPGEESASPHGPAGAGGADGDGAAPSGKGIKVAAAVLVAAAIVAALFWLLADHTPPLTREILEARRRQWTAANIREYSLAITVQNATQAPQHYRIEVRDGVPVSFSLNGKKATAEYTARARAYTIDGLFETIARELDLVEGRGGAAGAAALRGAVLRAEFDERYGFPRVYKRIAPEMRSTFITVDAFEPGENARGS